MRHPPLKFDVITDWLILGVLSLAEIVNHYREHKPPKKHRNNQVALVSIFYQNRINHPNGNCHANPKKDDHQRQGNFH
jgi:hypothetical protein